MPHLHISRACLGSVQSGNTSSNFYHFFIRKQNASLVNAQLPHESSFRHTMCPPQPPRFALSIFCKPRHRGAHHTTSESKHLKGQLDPRVGKGHVFWTKGGQLDPPVGNGHIFGSKVVSWISLLVTSHFLDQGGRLDLPVGDVTFLHHRRSVRSPCWLRTPQNCILAR